jgi:hypothetical protein
MRRSLLGLVLLGLVFAWPTLARAGTYADALSACLIQATTPADQKVAARWAFATLALDPDVAPMAAVTSAQRAAINQQAGTLVTSLLVQSCSQPVQQTLMFEGAAGAQAAFEAWARWALAQVAAKPQVQQGASALLQYIDLGQLMSLMPLQGLPPVGSGTR